MKNITKRLYEVGGRLINVVPIAVTSDIETFKKLA
jgi:hypothetical protein